MDLLLSFVALNAQAGEPASAGRLLASLATLIRATLAVGGRQLGPFSFEGLQLLFQLGTFAGQLCPFQRDIDFRLPQLLFEFALQVLDALAFLAE